MKNTLKIAFKDFWASFNVNNNLFTKLLSEDYNVIINEQSPDIVFFSVFGIENLAYSCKKVFFTGENIRPNFKLCDFAFSFDYNDTTRRNFRLPLYALFGDVNKLTADKDPEKILAAKTKFCNFVYSNPGAKDRIYFFRQLNKYKKVDSGGRFLNNIGQPVPNKLDFIKDYKFTIAFENSSYPGYTTEKIFEPMLVNSLPIYWGNPLVNKDFNTKSFINYYDINNLDDLIEFVIEIDQNDDKYMKFFEEPWFVDNKVNNFADNNIIKAELNQIINTNIKDLPIEPRLTVKPLNGILQKSTFYSNKTYKKIKNFSFDRIKVKLYQKQFE